MSLDVGCTTLGGYENCRSPLNRSEEVAFRELERIVGETACASNSYVEWTHAL